MYFNELDIRYGIIRFVCEGFFKYIFALSAPQVSLFLYLGMIKTLAIQLKLRVQVKTFYDAIKNGSDYSAYLLAECTGEKY